MGGKGYKPYTSLTGKKVSGDWEDSDRGAGNKATRRAGGKVKKKSPTYLAHVHNKEEVVHEGDYHSGQGEKVQARTKKWMDKKGQKGAPGLDAMKARTAEHKAKRGVKEEVVDEGLGAGYAIGGIANAVASGAKAYGASQAAKGAIIGGALSGAGSVIGGALNYAASRNKNKKSDPKKKKTGVKEDFIREVNVEDSNPNSNKKKIDVMKGKNKVKLMPNVKEQIDKEKEKEDPAIAQKQKQATMLKKRVLMQKLKAVRGGAGESIMAHNKPKGEVIEGVGISTADKMKKAKEEASLRKKEQDKIKQKTNEQKECDCDCGQDPCIKCGESHHNIKTEALLNLVKNRLKLKGLNMSHQPQPKLVEKIKDKVKESDFVTESLSALKFTVK